MKLLYTKF